MIMMILVMMMMVIMKIIPESNTLTGCVLLFIVSIRRWQSNTKIMIMMIIIMMIIIMMIIIMMMLTMIMIMVNIKMMIMIIILMIIPIIMMVIPRGCGILYPANLTWGSLSNCIRIKFPNNNYDICIINNDDNNYDNDTHSMIFFS